MKSKKKRILHVIASLEGGGAERQLQLLVNNSDSCRYQIAILFVNKLADQNIFNKGIELIHIPRGSKWNILLLWIKIYKAVMAYQPDILQLWFPEIITVPSAFAGKLSGACIVSAVRRSLRSVNSLKQRLRDMASYVQYIMSDKIVSNFNPDEEPFFFRKLFYQKKGSVIPNAIVVNTARTDTDTASLINPEATFQLWHVGRFAPQKRIDILLDSFAELKKEGLDIALVICGSGSVEQVGKLKDKVRENALEEYVIFPGNRNDWHYLAKDADLFVFPSTSEGMPNALFEAMLLGLPCIATDIPVISSMVKHQEHAWLAQAGSQISFSDGIRKMYNSSDLRKQLAQAGSLYARSFSIEKMELAYDTLYKECNKSDKN